MVTPPTRTKAGGTLMRSLRFAFVISFSLIALISASASAQSGMAARVEQLEAQVAALEELLQFVRVDAGGINGLAGPHWIFEGVNVHVRSGTGSTHGPCSDDPDCARRRGLGNLIVGYNEGIPSHARLRRGTHNLVVGGEHQYIQSGGFVAGHQNALWGQSASVTGGERNLAIGERTSICGGKINFAAGAHSSVGGGLENGASGDFSSVSGGTGNIASGESSVVGGGFENEASGRNASVSGGGHNDASGANASVGGGAKNEASGRNASVSGGGGNFASAPLSAISGGRNNAADALAASVSGGNGRDAPDQDNWAAGSLLEPN
jgi:hypothetical protein